MLLNRKFFKDIGIPSLDILELFAFIYPAKNITPSFKGLCKELGLEEPKDTFSAAQSLFRATEVILKHLKSFSFNEQRNILNLATVMQVKGNWLWGGLIRDFLGKSEDFVFNLKGYDSWKKLSEWEERTSYSPSGTRGISIKEAEEELEKILLKIPDYEEREGQHLYLRAVTKAFDTRDKGNNPQVVLAQAGTGIGKTLAYLSSALAWSKKNSGSVWISTYTKNLQNQIDLELLKFFKNKEEKDRTVVIRKGRENYLCLLKYAEAVSKISQSTNQSSVYLGMVARWLLETKDGDLKDGDFPSWLSDLMGKQNIKSLTDYHRECIYQQCPYFRKCFIEKTIRRSRRAKIVISNHALTMSEISGKFEEKNSPTRYIFDEAHHLFNSADNTFCSIISGFEGEEVHRWLKGKESNLTFSHNKGLFLRIEELGLKDSFILSKVEEVLIKSSFLVKTGWLLRIKKFQPQGEMEEFLSFVYQRVKLQSESFNNDDNYDLESEVFPLSSVFSESIKSLSRAIISFCQPLRELIVFIEDKIDKEETSLDFLERQKYFSLIRALKRMVLDRCLSWHLMLETLLSGEVGSDEIMWFSIEKNNGQESDVSFQSHFLNPMETFGNKLSKIFDGVLFTSATLKENNKDQTEIWDNAFLNTGAQYLKGDINTFEISSPFNYQSVTKVFIVSDVNKKDIRSISIAMKELFLASKGGCLGIFTSIKRLKQAYFLLKDSISEEGIKLLSQHIHDLNTTSLLDIFREDENSCLLGTDAVRDGIDVPGRALRLLIFERVPWSRPTISHKARREFFGKDSYERMLVKMRLSQAYGRLIRSNKDKGALVILDRGFPTNLEDAFPAGVEVNRINLKETVCMLKEWL